MSSLAESPLLQPWGRRVDFTMWLAVLLEPEGNSISIQGCCCKACVEKPVGSISLSLGSTGCDLGVADLNFLLFMVLVTCKTSPTFSLIFLMFILCVRVCVVHTTAHAWCAEGHLYHHSLLLPRGSLESNSGHWASRQEMSHLVGPVTNFFSEGLYRNYLRVCQL